ncbi:hypothetical protein [Neorhodopirellula pilleata]|uniref:DUF3592 domain-containing protein n=1 Tax=Neorhodopirellula pilleata TaxID=2714738 RepID=A0A5C6AI37_9BACT|nr:hypothetical protein [Neorhodopirellula pilleata]TWT98908.1 hypothetical protein Pla100_20740 [Neorhodopirellula pilleata]
MNENPYSVTAHDTRSDGPAPMAAPQAETETKWPIEFDGGFSQTWSVVVPILVGLLAIIAALLMFAINLWVIDVDNQLTFHLTTTAPTIFGVFSIMAGLGARGAARMIRLWPQGIEIQREQVETIPWSAITGIQISDSSSPAAPHEKVIVLSGADGEPISRITGKIAKNESLQNCLKHFTNRLSQIEAPQGANTKRPVASQASRKKGRRMAILTGLGGLLLAAAGIFLPLTAYQEHQAALRLTNEGVAGQGIVTEKFVAPNGRTLRIRYAVTSVDGQRAEHNVEVDEAFYDRVNQGDAVSITTVPDDPHISVLQNGEVISNDPTDNPIVTGLLGLFGIVAACFMLPMTVLMWKGYDINFNNGKFQLVPMA